MTEQPQPAPPFPQEVMEQLHAVPLLDSLNTEGMQCLSGAKLLQLEDGALLLRQGELVRKFWILLSGSVRVLQTDKDGHESEWYQMAPGATFGEVPLLASIPAPMTMRAMGHVTGLELNEEQFWTLMTGCPDVRRKILGNMAARLQKMQNSTFQQEKMASLGTMAAGLMHELNNPGAAARRASSQLRENLLRMHRLSRKFADTGISSEQKHCLFALQERALLNSPETPLSSLEQSDAEEALAEWMDEAQVADAWKLAPSLSAAGLKPDDLECTRSLFSGDIFSDALGWVEALVASMQLVGTVEESIGRVTELVMAVKSYAYEGRGQRQALDVNKSLHATLVILGHKLREKEIVLEKEFAADLPPLQTDCQGLNQVWTNLIDNAIDASNQHGHVKVRTWAERGGLSPDAKNQTTICIEIHDNGSGIPLDSQPHVFDPFYTTKPAGVGTGLGLGIVHRIVEQFGGAIHFSSTPGETIFLVRLPTERV